MTREVEQKRLVLLRKYCQQLVSAKIPKLLVKLAYEVWKQGVYTYRDIRILDQLDYWLELRGLA